MGEEFAMNCVGVYQKGVRRPKRQQRSGRRVGAKEEEDWDYFGKEEEGKEEGV